MKLARTIVLAGLLAFAALPSFGQSDMSRRVYGLTLGGLFPAGAFADHVSQDGFSLGAYYAWRLRRTPFFVGAELSYHLYGHTSRDEYLEGIPEVPLHVVTENSIGQGLLFVRLQPRSGRVVTFIEGLAGFSYIWTETSIPGDTDAFYGLASKTNFDDVTWTAGAGAGLGIRLDKHRVQIAARERAAFLEIKARYMAGGWANYLKKGSIVVVGNEFSFTPERSATSFVTVLVGYSYFF